MVFSQKNLFKWPEVLGFVHPQVLGVIYKPLYNWGYSTYNSGALGPWNPQMGMY
jgi:hypothetical protein